MVRQEEERECSCSCLKQLLQNVFIVFGAFFSLSLAFATNGVLGRVFSLTQLLSDAGRVYIFLINLLMSFISVTFFFFYHILIAVNSKQVLIARQAWGWLRFIIYFFQVGSVYHLFSLVPGLFLKIYILLLMIKIRV